MASLSYEIEEDCVLASLYGQTSHTLNRKETEQRCCKWQSGSGQQTTPVRREKRKNNKTYFHDCQWKNMGSQISNTVDRNKAAKQTKS